MNGSESIGGVPTFEELLACDPPGASWTVFGAENRLGTINFLTPERVVDATGLVRTGRRINLDYPVNAFEPFPSGTRRASEHHMFANNEFHRDDYLDAFYLQSTSQIDALRHIGHPEYGFYGGISPDENEDPGDERLGIQTWAQSGIVGRGVLLDFVRHAAENGWQWDSETTIQITSDMIEEVAAAQGVSWRGGELLLLRTGWAEEYLSKDVEQRAEYNRRNASPGLAQRQETVRWLWDHQIALAASDTPGLESDPVLASDYYIASEGPPARGVDHRGMLHRPLIALLGLAVGELWKLDELAEACRSAGAYEFFLSCKPLNLPGGAGSPPNALAIL